ncbi:hypothetical protein D9757_006580 [Collybiopsis confluens]|uniref:Uncharacterized protein n=1 Tax=Collybiopsis confluens TaxID=2823264 RepID=A0A8H5HQV2_9AGAR|nr:hypothetical protein D9757_006580 [Collybiopsis confluens]
MDDGNNVDLDPRIFSVLVFSQDSNAHNLPLYLTEHWDAPGPQSILRLTITSPPFLAHPLRLYALSTHFGWIPEAKLASKHTLGMNLYEFDIEAGFEEDGSGGRDSGSETVVGNDSGTAGTTTPASNTDIEIDTDPDSESFSALALRSIPSSALLALLRLHRTRRDLLKKHLDDPHIFSQGNSDTSRCTACNNPAPIDNSAWRELKSRVFSEMDKCPRGDFIGSWEMEEWKETRRCWESKCAKCGEVLYSKGATIGKILEGLRSLPETV